MNANAKKWVEALRSGEFEQARSGLQVDGSGTNQGYCCLGVACEVYRRETGDGEWQSDAGEYFLTFKTQGHMDASDLPPSVQEWLGLVDTAGTYVDERGVESLAGDNDLGATFTDIAATIEKQPSGLFIEGVK